MKWTGLVAMCLIGFLILMSCGNNGNDSERDNSNDPYEERQDTINRDNQRPTSDLKPIDENGAERAGQLMAVLNSRELDNFHAE